MFTYAIVIRKCLQKNTLTIIWGPFSVVVFGESSAVTCVKIARSIYLIRKLYLIRRYQKRRKLLQRNWKVKTVFLLWCFRVPNLAVELLYCWPVSASLSYDLTDVWYFDPRRSFSNKSFIKIFFTLWTFQGLFLKTVQPHTIWNCMSCEVSTAYKRANMAASKTDKP